MKTLHVNLSTEPAGPIAFKEGMRPFITVRKPQESNGQSISPVKTPGFFFQIFRWGRIPWGFCFKHSDGQVFGRLGKALFWAGFPFTSICFFNRVGNHSLVLVGCEESPLGAQYGAHVEWYRSIIAPSSLITTKMLLDIPSCFVAQQISSTGGSSGWWFVFFLPFHLTNFLTSPFLSMPKSYQLPLFDPPVSRVSSGLPRW